MSRRHDDPSRRSGGSTATDPLEFRRGSSSLSDPEALPPRLRRRRAFTLVLLTFVAPGSAQIVAGNRGLGRVALRSAAIVGLLVVAALATYLISPATILGIVVRPWFLAALTVGLLVAGVLWAVLFLDALRLARLRLVPPGTRRLVALLTALLMIVTTGATFTGAWVAWAGRTAVGGVFDGGQIKPPADGRYNVLLLGSDAGDERIGVRPDTLMLASVDAATGRSALFGIARDTENITFREGSIMAGLLPQGWNCGDQCLLNGIYQWAMEHEDQFPDHIANPGAEATKEAVEAFTGLDVQYYAMVDLVGFRRFVDAVGGIDMEVGRRTPIGGGTSPISGWIEPGRQNLDGYHALWYARSREGASNYDRMARQKCVTTAMLHQLDATTVITRAQQIAEISGGTVETDIPAGNLGRLGALAMEARDGEMTTVNLTPPLIEPWSYDPDRVHEIVRRTLAGQDPTEPTTTGATGTTPTPTPETTTPSAEEPATGGAQTAQPPAEEREEADLEYAFAVSDDDGLICGVP